MDEHNMMKLNCEIKEDEINRMKRILGYKDKIIKSLEHENVELKEKIVNLDNTIVEYIDTIKQKNIYIENKQKEIEDLKQMSEDELYSYDVENNINIREIERLNSIINRNNIMQNIHLFLSIIVSFYIIFNYKR